MAFKGVVFCVVACLIQQSIGGPYYPPKPPCGCGSGKVSITKIEEGLYYPPKPPCGCGSGKVSIAKIEEGPYYPPKPPCGCGSGKVSINKIEKIEKIGYRPNYSSGCVSIEIPNNGGALAVTSIGPIAPTGIAVATDLALGGDLTLSGVLPYLSAVAFEGQIATGGAVPVAYGCGDSVAITEQIGGIGASPYGPSLHARHGCGCKY